MMWRNHWVIINLHIFESNFFFRSLTILLLNLWFPWSFVRVCFALNKIFTIPLDFRDRIIKTSLAFNHLVVATTSQCYIYRLVVLEWVWSLNNNQWTKIIVVYADIYHWFDIFAFYFTVSETGTHQWYLTSRMETSPSLSRLKSKY